MKKLVLTILSCLAFQFISMAQDAGYLPEDIAKIRTDVKSKRVGSYDKSGGNDDRVSNIEPGKKITLMDIKGAGIINHIWMTIGPDAGELNRNDIILRMFWDGNSSPSVEAPLAYFFGNGWNETYDFVTPALLVSPGRGRSYVSYFSMPFSNGAKIEIENQSDHKIDMFYFNIDYVEMSKLPPDNGRFHAWFNREITDGTPDGEDEWGRKNANGKGNYLIADIKGKGQYVGVNYYLNSPGPIWYGEGDEMVFIDGDTIPSIIGTGTEDYFNMSWSPKDYFISPYFGCARANGETGWLGRTHTYRFHFKDPIYFDKSLKFTIEHGHSNSLTLDLATVAYWYQSVATGVPPIPGKEARKLSQVNGAWQIRQWRNEWLKQNSKTKGTWGN